MHPRLRLRRRARFGPSRGNVSFAAAAIVCAAVVFGACGNNSSGPGSDGGAMPPGSAGNGGTGNASGSGGRGVSTGASGGIGGAPAVGGNGGNDPISGSGGTTSGAAGASAGSGGQPQAMTYRNPVIPGFHPDPSVCRVGNDFYLVNSTFEYFPGVPIFHSRDLVNWRQIGHALTRPSQLALTGAASSGGIYAPTLRCHDGTFYMITTNVSSGGHFFVTTEDPAGEWSEPIRVDDSGGGIDPSLFFDDDGKVYYTRHAGGERGGIDQAEIDVKTGRLAAAPKRIWSGTGGIWPEGPHLYKLDGTYYLLIAEGGTGYTHAVTVARASSPWGPFESYPGNPVLSHRERPESPIQATGHGDLIQTAAGDWWMVFLGIRPQEGRHHNLGRETFLAPVSWNAMGWPVVNGNEPIQFEMSAAGLPPLAPWPAEPARDEFTGARLGLAWNFLRNPRAQDWSLSARSGFLRLIGSTVSLDDVGSPAFVARRQEHLRCRASVALEFAPTASGQEAGLTVRQNEDHHYDLFVTLSGTQRRIQLRTRVGGVSTIAAERDIASGAVSLTIEAYPDRYEFLASAEGAAAQSLGTAPTTSVSTEVAGGFTGVYLGMYARAPSATGMPPADFDWFEYQPLANEP